MKIIRSNTLAHVGCDLVPSRVTAWFDIYSLQSLSCDGVTP
jgi:hypothetical protein